MKRDAESGISISLRIPARDPDLFKNKSTNDVLLFLSRQRLDSFAISEIADQTGHPKTTVSRAVDVLENNGLVTARYTAASRRVEINRELLSVPEDPIMRIPQVEFHEPVKAAVEKITERVDELVAIVLYGSVARGEADWQSDIDLWVLVRENRAEHRRTINEVERDLEETSFEPGNRFSYHVDVEDVGSIPMYTADVREIVVSGITLFENDRFETVENLLRNEVGDGE